MKSKSKETIISKAQAYSYIRFSSVKQSTGTSKERQEKRITRWLEENPKYELNTTRFEDLGVSGYSGKHIQQGGLGLFLKAVESGQIKPESVLIVESVDRIGRLETVDAIEILTKLFKDDITIITLEDGQQYNRESLNSGGGIFILVGKIQAAYQYSKQLSERLLISRKRKRDDVIVGTEKKITRNCPWWLEWCEDKEDWKVLSKKLELVVFIFKRCREGAGVTRIAKELNEHYQGESPSGKGWHQSAISRVLRERKVLGEVESKGEWLKDYYPPVIEKEAYRDASIILRSRQGVRDRLSKHSNVKEFDVLHNLVFCQCGKQARLLNKANDTYIYTCTDRIRGVCNNSNGVNQSILHNRLDKTLRHKLGMLKFSYGFLTAARTGDAEERAAELQQQLDRLVSLYKLGLCEIEEIETAKENLEVVKEKIENGKNVLLKPPKTEEEYNRWLKQVGFKVVLGNEYSCKVYLNGTYQATLKKKHKVATKLDLVDGRLNLDS